MFFDTLAGIVERHLPEFTQRMQAAALFRLEGREQRSMEEAAVEWEPDEKTIENFRLPFPNLFVEYADGRTSPNDRGILLFAEDMSIRRIGFLTGWVHKDGDVSVGAGSFIAIPDAEDGRIPETQNQRIAVMKTAMRIWEGGKKNLARLPSQWDVECELVRNSQEGVYELVMPRDKEKILQLIGECRLSRDKMAGQSAYLSCCVAVLSILVINEPGRFIVEERPLLPPGEPKNLAVPRSLGRPHYIVLKPRQIRERFLYPDRSPLEQDEQDEERRKVTPHERRGHYRTLRSERFRHAKGRVVWIDPLWVGPSEAVRGPNKYTVRLDL